PPLHGHPRALRSFPTRRSSDLTLQPELLQLHGHNEHVERLDLPHGRERRRPGAPDAELVDWYRPWPSHGNVRQRRSAVCERRSRSEEHTSELQSLAYLVCRLLL